MVPPRVARRARARARGGSSPWTLVGEADADGAAESNLPLSQRRAERILGLLAPPRLEHVTLTARGIGSRSAATPGEDEANKQRNRRVSFYVNRDADRR